MFSEKAISSILGGLFGAWLFSVTYGFWKNIGLFQTMDLGKLTLFQISEKYPAVFDIGYWGLLAVGIIFMAIAALLPVGKYVNKK